MANGLSHEEEAWEGGAQFNRKEQALEVGIFLFLIMPSMAFSFLAVKHGSVGFELVALSTILRDLALLSLILFFLWRNQEPLVRIGWRFQSLWKEVLLGMILFIPFFFAAGLLESALLSLGFSSPSTPLPSLQSSGGIAQSVLALVLVAVVAVTEENIFRGYLILRFKSVFRSSAAAVILSALIFSLGHGYEGSAGVITVGFMGTVFALVYLWRRSLVAPIVMHFIQDFISIVLMPILATRL